MPCAAQTPVAHCAVDLKTPAQVETPYGVVELTEDSAILLQQDALEIQSALKASGEAKKTAIKNYFAQKSKPRALVAMVFANYALAMVIGAELAQSLIHDSHQALMAAALIPPTFFVADFISGVFHKWLDSYASETNPLWGGSARAFRVHHEFPSNLNEIAYLQNVASFAPLLAPMYVALTLAPMAPDLRASALLLLLLFSNGTEIHRQAHLANPSAWVRTLQRLRIFLNRSDHQAHHRSPTDTDFGIVNGWSNPLNRQLDLENRIDKIVWKALGRMPHNWVHYPDSIPESVIADLLKDISLLPEDLVVSLQNKDIKNPQLDEVLRLWVARRADLE